MNYSPNYNRLRILVLGICFCAVLVIGGCTGGEPFIDAPDIPDFKDPGISSLVPCPSTDVVQLVRKYLSDNDLQMLIVSDETITSFISGYDNEPKIKYRSVQAAYLIQVVPSKQPDNSTVTLKWLTRSKGDGEKTWRIDDEVQGTPKYVPVFREEIKNLCGEVEKQKEKPSSYE